MPDPTPTTMQQLQADSLTMIANVSRLLRQAIGAALPVAPEQYVTIAIPGTVIDLTDVEQGGTFVWDITNNAFPPTAVRQAEANLVDTMMPISNVMVGWPCLFREQNTETLTDWKHWKKRCQELFSRSRWSLAPESYC